jgi:hypothetical protein
MQQQEQHPFDAGDVQPTRQHQQQPQQQAKRVCTESEQQMPQLQPPEKVLLPPGGLKQLNRFVCERRGWPLEVCEHKVRKRSHGQRDTPVIEYWLPCTTSITTACDTQLGGSSGSGRGAASGQCYEGYNLGCALPRVSASLLALGRLQLCRSRESGQPVAGGEVTQVRQAEEWGRACERYQSHFCI